MPRAGSYRHRIEFRARVTSTEDVDFPTTDWQAHATVWADIKEGAGQELIQNLSLQNAVPAVITIRYRADINFEMQAVDVCGSRAGCDGRQFSILGVSDTDGRHRELRIDARRLMQLAGVADEDA